MKLEYVQWSTNSQNHSVIQIEKDLYELWVLQKGEEVQYFYGKHLYEDMLIIPITGFREEQIKVTI